MPRYTTRPSVRQKGPIGFRTLGVDGPVAAHILRAAADWAWGISIGVVAVATGIVALFDADATLRTVTVLIGLSQAVQGILSILGAWHSTVDRKSRRRRLLSGMILVAAGASSLSSTSTQWLVISSAIWFAIIAAQDFIDASKSATARTSKLTLGIVSLLGAALVLTHPDVTLPATARYIGITLLCRGTLQVVHSWMQHNQPRRTVT